MPLKPLLLKPLLVVSLGAILLPVSAGWAAPPDAPAPAAAASPPAAAPAAAPPASAPAPTVLPAPQKEVLSPPQAIVPSRPAAHKASAPVSAAARLIKARLHPVIHHPKPVFRAALYPQAPAKPAALAAKPLPAPRAVPVQIIAPQAPAPIYRPVSVPKPAAVRPAPPRALPDYGGRDAITGTVYVAQSSPALNPLAQAWRAFEALAIVIALIFGGLYGMKRFGLIKSDGTVSASLPALAGLPGLLKQNQPARSQVPAGTALPPQITIISSQALPHAPGASLQLVSLNGKTLLLGVTAQSVSLISEMDDDRQSDPFPSLDTGQMPISFDGFLTQADRSPLRQSNETELLMNATTMRLQAMISRSEAEVNGHRS